MAESRLPEQKHPQWAIDRATADQILQQDMTDLGLVELARLKIRYQGFPGARDIQDSLATALKRWNLSEAELFAKTRAIHSQQRVYRNSGEDLEDWT
ncbi:DUF3288 family protein [Prochlorothrix hollandica]|uniref:DUF3288 domain-containing protein n=1 Tax=Prochlorothrix hollandica PCC 9006 = CALU 1027 TaxID=317619 RepID=A0A0M2PX58_PROHO|nr:DUF3288 family protein [Prochlorothrix hollandica]KKJ01016.1 hypothetical protein PROH_00860 [Prochlorothrix hollandica PCC 9006 = CALU 1027]